MPLTELTLLPGRYWITFASGNFVENAKSTLSTPVNAFGSPNNNNFMYVYDPFSSRFWEPVVFGDLSFGIEGTPVPEPSSAVLMATGIAAFVRKRHSK
jgi:hypothetical protein